MLDNLNGMFLDKIYLAPIHPSIYLSSVQLNFWQKFIHNEGLFFKTIPVGCNFKQK